MRTQRMAALAAAAAVLLTHGDAGAQYYTLCNSPGNSNCTMYDTGDNNVMTGSVNQGLGEGNAIPVHVMFYGPWNSTIDNNYIVPAIVRLLLSLDDSVYTATIKTYAGPSGSAGTFDWVDTRFATGANDPSKSAVEQMMVGNFGSDPNALYLFLTDTNVFLQGNDNCQSDGGQNWQGSGIHVAYVQNLYGNCQPHYSWACVEGRCGVGCNGPCGTYQTPNNAGGADQYGAIDLTLSNIAHELFERATDPGDNNGGWQGSVTGQTDQEADLCGPVPGYPQATGQHLYTVGASIANFHGYSGDFLLQTERVNAQVTIPPFSFFPWESGLGYCATTYGGVFSAQNFGYLWSPIGDWKNGSYKGECQPGQPLIGLSQNTGGNHNPHAVMCGSASDGTMFPQNGCQAKTITSGTTWCPSGDYAAGVAQSQSGVPDALLCCSGNGTNGFGCWNQAFNSANMGNSWTPYDWDYGSYKAECSSGNFVGGVVTNSSNQLTSIVCCGPTSGG